MELHTWLCMDGFDWEIREESKATRLHISEEAFLLAQIGGVAFYVDAFSVRHFIERVACLIVWAVRGKFLFVDARICVYGPKHNWAQSWFVIVETGCRRKICYPVYNTYTFRLSTFCLVS